MKRLFNSSQRLAARWLLRLALPAALLAFVASGAAPTRAQDEDQFPFSAVYQGQFFANVGTGSAITQNGGAFGFATFLGQSSAGFSQTVTSTTDASAISNGSFSLLGVDGNTIFGTYDGQISAPDASGMATLAGSFTITNGTVGFAGVTGTGALSGTINLATGNMTISFNGTLSPGVPSFS